AFTTCSRPRLQTAMVKTICVVGTGYVGLVTGACFAELGNQVSCIDTDATKIARLQAGGMPIYEPGLAELVQRNVVAGRLSFTTSYQDGMHNADFVFIAVNTPMDAEGGADLSFVASAAQSIAANLDHELIIVNKSTVPAGTGDMVQQLVERHMTGDARFWVVSNPEFLREGSAIYDCLHPDRVVLGSRNLAACEAVAALYRPLKSPILMTDLPTAEMIKYASNAMLATRISFINEIAAVCEQIGADVRQVARGMGYDKRIGPLFLDAGVGYGGSCFPKDVKALIRLAATKGCHPELLRAVEDINLAQRERVVDKLRALLGGLSARSIGLLGLAFKPGTDDMREAPAVEIAARLLAEGAAVSAYDPVAMPRAAKLIPEISLCSDAYDLASGADALVLVTDWTEFTNLDMPRIKQLMRTPVLVDGRNLYDGPALRELGFIYCGSGREGAVVSRLLRGQTRVPHRRATDPVFRK
ncbi:MAG TPA: UDP-glucose/GDP-mannose dehydrogenase family protein, partial [Chloroflexota bacterium]